MRQSIKFLLITALIFFLAAPGLFAQNAAQAVIRELSGTVELKQPGATAWQPATRGQTLTGDTVVSTGFRSNAIIALGNSMLTVQPLTRLTLAELSRAQNVERVEINLTTGRVRAEVKPPVGSRADFTISSPSATASVRGTTFEFDTINLTVSEGTVSFAGASGVPVIIDAGGLSSVDERSGRAASAVETLLAELKPALPVTWESTTSDRPVEIPADNTGQVTAIVKF